MPEGLCNIYRKGGIPLFMLPGFRFLFAAIVLSMSILVFGLGAAALLRAAHEEFVSAPSWRAVPETVFAQQSDATRPVLATLSVAPPVNGPNQALAEIPATAVPAEQAATVAAPAAREPDVALEPAASPPPEPVRSESHPEEIPAPSETAPAPDNVPAADAARIAATEPTSLPASEAAAASAEPSSNPVSAEGVNAPDAADQAPAPAAVEQAGTPPAATEQASAPAAVGQASASASAEQTEAPAGPATDPVPVKVVKLSSPSVNEEPPLAKHETIRARSHGGERRRQQAERLARHRRIAQRPQVDATSSPQPASPQPAAPVMPSSFYYSVPHGGS
jgi:hypothetical protein